MMTPEIFATEGILGSQFVRIWLKLSWICIT